MIRLKLYRRFYQKQKEIGPTMSDQLASLASVVTLLTIDNPKEHRFYKLEAEAAEVQYL